MPGRTKKKAGARVDRGKVVRLRPANPFDLIRLIALSQNDPRKALAELVQNSLDAGARHVTLTRFRLRGELAVSVLDDGGGIFPELARPDALERIATNIGRSFKKDLSPAERREAMMLGKYGIGILGFWSVGESLEVRTRVAGSDVWALRLLRDQPEAAFFPVAQRRIQFEGDTWTELVIARVNETAGRQIGGRRLNDYLASELRGQLLDRSVKLRVVDRIARGKALKEFLVVPQRFRGKPLLRIDALPVAGHAPARVELYLAEAGGEAGGEGAGLPTVVLTCGGTVVSPDLAQAEGVELSRPPWSEGKLEGVVEFPDLEVAPATRRGFQPGPASEALIAALRGIEPEVLRLLAAERERRAEEEDEDLSRELRKVFRPLVQSRPHYDLFEISGGPPPGRPEDQAGAELGKTSGTEEAGAAREPESEVVEEGGETDRGPELIPPGPLARVVVTPRRSKLLPGASRSLLGRALDEAGARIEEGVEWVWALTAGPGLLVADGARAVYTAPEATGLARVSLEARQGADTARAEAEIEVVERLPGDQDAGIPDPHKVHDPAGDWRSRLVGRRWEYNSAHPDYAAVRDESRRRFRYLVHLFAKEVVLRNYPGLEGARLLEKMVEVLTHIRPRA